jgi:hypothetical protein
MDEEVVCSRLIKTHTSNIVVPEQSGFRRGISPENTPYKLKGSVFNSLNEKKTC